MRPDTLEITAGVEQQIQLRPIALNERFRARGDLIEMVKGNHAQQFGGVGGSGGKQVVQSPDALGERGFGENPTTAQTGESVRLGQAAGCQEMASQVKRRSLRPVKERLEVNFIDQHTRAAAPRDLSDGAQGSAVHQGAARIVQVCENYQT